MKEKKVSEQREKSNDKKGQTQSEEENSRRKEIIK